MKVFEIKGGKVSFGVELTKIVAQGKEGEESSFYALTVGTINRHGRWGGLLPVSDKLAKKSSVLRWASLGKSQSGRPKLVKEKELEANYCLIVFRTPAGLGGANEHTGQQKLIPEGNQMAFLNESLKSYLPFPGRILVSAEISKSWKDYFDSSYQLIAVMPKDRIFRVAYSDQRGLHEYYYKYDGQSLNSVLKNK